MIRLLIATSIALAPIAAQAETVFDPATHLARQESSWGEYKKAPLEEKLVPVPARVLDYLIKDNIRNGWPERPVAVTLDAQYRKDIVDALREIPQDIAAKVARKLVALSVVRNLGGSAYTEDIYSTDGRRVAGFVVLDIAAMDRAANAWATWKERTPFKSDGAVEVTATIESRSGDLRKNALQYILLHEFGHILSIGLDDVAPWGLNVGDLKPISSYGFTALSWTSDGKTLKPKADVAKFDRSGLRYYGPEEQRLPSVRASSLYRQIKATDFPTLYAATNPSDDFAESFASFIHTERMKRPWSIGLVKKGAKPTTFSICWKEKRCAAKRRKLEEILTKL